LLTRAILGLLLAAPAAAQGARGNALTTVRYVSLRPIALDTVPRAEVVEIDGELTFDGQPVFCLADGNRCVQYRPQGVEHAVVATQDVSATAWGFGVQGLSATLLVRGRADLGGELTWPRSDDEFDAILAYAQLQRSIYRVRLGRQRTLSGLGFSGFDGLDVLVEPLEELRAEAYAGRSLARGLYEPVNDALRNIEDFVLDQDAYLFGAFVEGEPWTGASVGARYQREIWRNRIGLISERAALDLRSDLPGRFRMDAALDYDVAFGRLGKAHVTLRSELPDDWGWAELSGRRYLPYFDMSTVWGFFSPVAFHEAEARATVTHWRPLTLWAGVGWRKYDDPEISIIGPSITDTSARYLLGARWVRGPWSAFGEYRLETDFGAFLSSGDLSVRWEPTERIGLTARGAAFQQIEQFRVGDNTVIGAGLGADVRLFGETELRAGADLYSQNYDNRPSGADFDQLRAYTILAVPFGEDPGMRGRR
jgi:hypothetical protein